MKILKYLIFEVFFQIFLLKQTNISFRLAQGCETWLLLMTKLNIYSRRRDTYLWISVFKLAHGNIYNKKTFKHRLGYFYGRDEAMKLRDKLMTFGQIINPTKFSVMAFQSTNKEVYFVLITKVLISLLIMNYNLHVGT